MNRSQSHKADQSNENSTNRKNSTTYLNTPTRPVRLHHEDSHVWSMETHKQCPYHFGAPSHICLTCRRSICLRCAVTYCQQHTIHPEEQILPLLLVDLQKLTLEPKIEDIEMKLRQSHQNQKYLSKQISKMLRQIEQNFEHVQMMLQRKKEQIIQYYQQELANKFLAQHQKYDVDLEETLAWLKDIESQSPNCTSIEELDCLATIVKKFNSKRSTSLSSSIEGKTSKLAPNNEKLRIHRIWSQEKLQKILYEIENIAYKLTKNESVEKLPSHKKKRVTTEISEQAKISPFFSGAKNVGVMKSSSNSRFHTGRKVQ